MYFLKGNSNKNYVSPIWKRDSIYFKTFLQIFCIVFAIKDITPHFKQNRYAFHHLGCASPSSDMRDVTTRATLFCIFSNSQAISMQNPIFSLLTILNLKHKLCINFPLIIFLISKMSTLVVTSFN